MKLIVTFLRLPFSYFLLYSQSLSYTIPTPHYALLTLQDFFLFPLLQLGPLLHKRQGRNCSRGDYCSWEKALILLVLLHKFRILFNIAKNFRFLSSRITLLIIANRMETLNGHFCEQQFSNFSKFSIWASLST